MKTLNAIRDMVGLSLDHYPGAMETLYVTNTPVVFQIAWRIINPCCPPKFWLGFPRGGSKSLPK